MTKKIKYDYIQNIEMKMTHTMSFHDVDVEVLQIRPQFYMIWYQLKKWNRVGYIIIEQLNQYTFHPSNFFHDSISRSRWHLHKSQIPRKSKKITKPSDGMYKFYVLEVARLTN
jgi:hypothetical protein